MSKKIENVNKESKEDVLLSMGHKKYKASMAYARAIFNYGKRFDQLGPMRKCFDDFIFIWDELYLLRQFIQCPAIDRKRRKEHVNCIFKENIHKGLLHLIERLIDNNHADLIRGIYDAFSDMVDDKDRKRLVRVISSIPMSQAQMKRLQDTMESYFEKEITIKNELDPSILGGFICYTDSVKIDMSLRKDLESLKSKILSAPCEGVQEK